MHRQFEVNSLFHRQPVELSQYRSDMYVCSYVSDGLFLAEMMKYLVENIIDN